MLEVRKRELGQLRKAIPMRVGMQSMLFAAPTLAMVACFAVYGSGEWCSGGAGGLVSIGCGCGRKTAGFVCQLW